MACASQESGILVTDFAAAYPSVNHSWIFFVLQRAELPEFICRFCSLQESGILLTDFAAAYPSVNHSWIFNVLEKAELHEFICRLVRMIYCDSTTHVEFAGKNRGQFLMARGVRQGCSAIGSLFATAFDPIFRWLRAPQTSSSLFRELMLMTLQWLLRPFDD